MDSAVEKDARPRPAPNFETTTWHILATRLEALLANWCKLALIFQGKFHCIKTINLRK